MKKVTFKNIRRLIPDDCVYKDEDYKYRFCAAMLIKTGWSS